MIFKIYDELEEKYLVKPYGIKLYSGSPLMDFAVTEKLCLIGVDSCGHYKYMDPDRFTVEIFVKMGE